MKIGFIGTGVMGTGMIRNLRKAGFDVEIYARNPQHAKHLTDEGIVMHDSVAGLCTGKDVLITIIGRPQDVEEIYLAPGGALESMKSGSVVIDMTTSSPSLARSSMLRPKIRASPLWMRRCPAALRAPGTAP